MNLKLKLNSLQLSKCFLVLSLLFCFCVRNPVDPSSESGNQASNGKSPKYLLMRHIIFNIINNDGTHVKFTNGDTARILTYKYDAMGNNIFLENRQPLARNAPVSTYYIMSYNNKGWLTKKIKVYGDTNVENYRNVTSYEYDKNGHMVKYIISGNDGFVFHAEPYIFGVQFFDSFGRLDSVKEFDCADSALRFITFYEYNARGLVTKATDESASDTTTTDYTYNAADSVATKSVTDVSLGKTVASLIYDSLNRKTEEIVTAYGQTFHDRYTYDINNNLIKIERCNSDTCKTLYTYEYQLFQGKALGKNLLRDR